MSCVFVSIDFVVRTVLLCYAVPCEPFAVWQVAPTSVLLSAAMYFFLFAIIFLLLLLLLHFVPYSFGMIAST